MPVTAAILLAAGESRRMGQLKALLPWQGSTLLAHQVAALRDGGVDMVVVVLGHQAERLQPALAGMEGVGWVFNPDYSQGKTTSIKAGLSALPGEALSAILLLNVDQPRSPETIRCLLHEHRVRGGLITIPEYHGKGGHPIILDPTLLDELRSINEETLGIKAVVRRHRDAARRVAMSTPEVLWDLNTPEQYRTALQEQVSNSPA